MLVEQTMEKLVAMQLRGMPEALRRWMEEPKVLGEMRLLPPADAGLRPVREGAVPRWGHPRPAVAGAVWRG